MPTFASARLPPTSSGSSVAKVRGSRLLVPKEHGAYFQLGFPLVSALAMGRPTTSALMFVVCATAAFLGHEPLLVAIGSRGPAARRQEGRRAARWLAMFALTAAGAGAVAWSTAPAPMGATLWVPIALAASLGGLIARGRERTALGELVAGAALTSAALPVGYASGVPETYVWIIWFTWLLVTSAGTWAVRTIIGVTKGSAVIGARIAKITAVVLAEAALTLNWPSAALAAAPTVALCIGFMVRPPHARALRHVGWSLAAATTIAALVLTVSVRRDARAPISVLSSTGER